MNDTAGFDSAVKTAGCEGTGGTFENFDGTLAIAIDWLKGTVICVNVGTLSDLDIAAKVDRPQCHIAKANRERSQGKGHALSFH
jgi:hypothetical protein